MKPVSPRTNTKENEETAFKFDTTTLSNQVETFLVRELISGHLVGGQRVNEAEMARKLGISRNPIREAVRRLEERGVLVSLPRRGTFVRTFTRKDVDDIFSFRLVVEDYSLQHGFSKLTEAHLEELVQTVRDMEAAAADDDQMTLVEKDLAFHHAICQLPDNHQSLHAFLNIEAELQLLIKMVDQEFETLHAAAADHWPVIEAFQSQNLETAREAIRFHIHDSWARLGESFDARDVEEET